jgi:hypothetical protein
MHHKLFYGIHHQVGNRIRKKLNSIAENRLDGKTLDAVADARIEVWIKIESNIADNIYRYQRDKEP